MWYAQERGQKRRYEQEHGILPPIKLQEHVVDALLRGGQQVVQ
jgi:hypothetical protein